MSKKSARKSRKPDRKPSVAKAAKKVARKAAKAVKKVAEKAAKKVAVALPTNLQRDRAIALFKFAHSTTTKWATGFSDQQMVAQATPTSNHVLWCLGHLAISNAWFASMIDGAPIGFSDEWDKVFGMNSKPVSDASAYPPISEVWAAYHKSAERLEDAARARTDADLLKPPAGDSGGFLNDRLDAIYKAAWHEGWHLGQIAEARKAAGLPSAMGQS
jgi:hypothetical protein